MTQALYAHMNNKRKKKITVTDQQDMKLSTKISMYNFQGSDHIFQQLFHS
jgi:hypothetical protein